MSKILITIFSFFALFFFNSCKPPLCSTLSWGETSQIEKNTLEVKFSAGKRCGNINDYWDNIDVEGLISRIQELKFIKNEKCKEYNSSIDDWVEFECPDFIPETLEFVEVVGCKFDTPPGDGDEIPCMAGPLVIIFASDTFFENIMWTFNPRNPEFYRLERVEGDYNVMCAEKDEIKMGGLFIDESFESFLIRFTWQETEGVEKKIELKYSVETKA